MREYSSQLYAVVVASAVDEKKQTEIIKELVSNLQTKVSQ